MNHGHDDFATEPVPGLPKELPVGEKMLWQGAPDWKEIAKRTFHIRKFAAYAAIIVIWHGVTTVYDGGAVMAAVTSSTLMAVLCAAAIGMLAGLAYLAGTGTVYTITSERVVMRFGIALPMTVQIPFSKIVGASLRRHKNGLGDIPLTIAEDARASYLVLWPHVRPWHLLRPEPMLRCIPNADEAAQILREALKASYLQEAGDDVAKANVQTTHPHLEDGKKEDRNGHGQWAAAAS